MLVVVVSEHPPRLVWSYQEMSLDQAEMNILTSSPPSAAVSRSCCGIDRQWRGLTKVVTQVTFAKYTEWISERMSDVPRRGEENRE